jgi:hypothetical protein
MTPGYAILISVLIALLVGIIATIFAPGPDKGLNRVLIWTAICCLWYAWFIVYASQANPFLLPVGKVLQS